MLEVEQPTFAWGANSGDFCVGTRGCTFACRVERCLLRMLVVFRFCACVHRFVSLLNSGPRWGGLSSRHVCERVEAIRINSEGRETNCVDAHVSTRLKFWVVKVGFGPEAVRCLMLKVARLLLFEVPLFCSVCVVSRSGDCVKQLLSSSNGSLHWSGWSVRLDCKRVLAIRLFVCCDLNNVVFLLRPD